MSRSCLREHPQCNTTLLWVPAHNAYRLIITDGHSTTLSDVNLSTQSESEAQAFADGKAQEVSPHNCGCPGWKFFAP